MKEIMGDHIQEFGKILDYRDELLRTNPGSTCVVKVVEPNADSRPVFQSFYICFDALKKAFQHCRKCIGLDGCFLKGVCRGQLLVAVCKDGNNQMLPLAWAVVEYENKSTWTWFIRILKEDLALGDGTHLTLITDMQKGLFVAIQDLLPVVEHRKCARHILANFSKDWRGLQRRQQFWRIAKSTFESQLRRNIEQMKLLGPTKMMDKLMYYNINYWCKVYFNTNVKVDSVDNNMAECFNAWIMAARTVAQEQWLKAEHHCNGFFSYCQYDESQNHSNTYWKDIVEETANIINTADFTSSHCYREANKVADYPAKLATKLDQPSLYHRLEHLPSGAKCPYVLDRMRLPSIRIRYDKANFFLLVKYVAC
ncbi:uncharacterized protein LOC132061178 [Lycium ferocissimum]|uniref:uncharacterized protein LOC132061178 n=1 Tax=Lycium ferocissimum TaxID=112874 RepID=UPI0028154AAA|nr:uncharacterized protein LOC132061178 [Lycium ferocissimum]